MPTCGLSERRRVVDAVARHRHDAALVLQALHRLGLLVRQHLGDDLVDPETAARRRRRSSRLSPVSMTIADALRVKLADRVGGRVLDRIGDAEQARRAAPSTATNMTVCPSARSASARSREIARRRCRDRPCSVRFPSATRLTVDVARHALAGDRLEVASASTSAMLRSRRTCERSQRPADARCRARGVAASRSRSRLVPARARARLRTSSGLPSVSVPVLSTTSVSTFRSDLDRLGVLEQDADGRALARRRP